MFLKSQDQFFPVTWLNLDMKIVYYKLTGPDCTPIEKSTTHVCPIWIAGGGVRGGSFPVFRRNMLIFWLSVAFISDFSVSANSHYFLSFRRYFKLFPVFRDLKMAFSGYRKTSFFRFSTVFFFAFFRFSSTLVGLFHLSAIYLTPPLAALLIC